MSDTVYHSAMIREAFPRDRHGGAKAAIYAAFRYMAPKLRKTFTERRARSIWEGTARRIDAEESSVLQRAKLEEHIRERDQLRARLASLDAQLAAVDEEFHGPTLAAIRDPSCGYGGRSHHERAPAPQRSPAAGSAGRLDTAGRKR